MTTNNRARRAIATTAAFGLLLGATATVGAADPGGGGAPDPGFGGDGTVDLPATTIAGIAHASIGGVAEAPDGSIRILWADSTTRLTRYSAAGALDTTFGTDGEVLLDGSPGQQTPTIAADGSTYVALGGVGQVIKLDATGDPDPAFGGDGRAEVAGLSSSTEVQLRSGGGVVVAAAGDLVALTASGTIDAGFTYGTEVYVEEVATLADHRLAVASSTGGVLAVLDPDGSPAEAIGLDPTRPGVLDTDITVHADRVATFAPRPGGGLVALVGYADGDEYGLFAVAFTATGARDTSFGEAGVVDLSVTTGDPTVSIFDLRPPAVDASGRVMIPLLTPIHRSQVLRLTADGQLDPTFGDGGRLLLPSHLSGESAGVVLADDGGMLATSPPPADVAWVARLTADGSDDASFAGDGFLAIGGAIAEPVSTRKLASQADGSTIVLQGAASPGALHGAQELTRLRPDGAVDASFGEGGRAPVLAREDVGDPTALAVDAFDRIYAAHSRAPDVWVVSRWLRDGSPDLVWGDGGVAALPFFEAWNNLWFSLAPQSDGGVLVAGAVAFPVGMGSCCDESFVTAIRLSPDGTLDAEYHQPRLSFDVRGTGADLTFLPDGSAIIGIETMLQRFTPSGDPDPAWHAGSVGSAAGCGVNRLVPWRHGGVLVVRLNECTPAAVPTIYALDAHGHPDPLIPAPTTVGLPLGSRVSSAAVDPYGRIILGVTGPGPAVVRLLPDGSPDPSLTTAIATGTATVDRRGRVLVWANPTIDDRRVTRLLTGPPPAPLPVALRSSPLRVTGTYLTATGDFDGDGTDDVLWYAPGTATDSIWYGRHTGGFTKRTVTINGTYQPVSGDFDGDGRTDLLFYASGSRPDFVWRSLPSGGFASSATSINGTFQPVPGDFDGDGRGDIVWYATGSSPDFLWTARATGGFASSPLTIGGAYQPVAGDFSGDGRTDLIFYAAGATPDRLWTARPTGGFSSSALTVNGTYRPVAGDLNGDGRDDVLWHGPGAAPDIIWLARHGGGFASQGLTVAGRYLPVSADVTGDGLADVLWYAPGTAQDHLGVATIP